MAHLHQPDIPDDPVSQPYHDNGPYSGKEVHYPSGEFGHGDTNKEVRTDVGIEVVPDGGKEVAAAESQSVEGSSTWRRRFWIVTAFIAAIIIVGIVVGCVVGLGVGKKTSKASLPPTAGSNTTATPVPPAKSVCRGKTCGQLFTSENWNNELYLFARGQDQAMWARVHNGVSWVGAWSSLGGQFQGQPNSVIWGLNTRINVIGVASSGATVLTKAYVNGSWEDNWRSMNVTGGSVVSTCYVHWDDGDHADIVVPSNGGGGNESGSMMLSILRGEGDPLYYELPKSQREFASFNPLVGRTGSAVGFVCRKDDWAQDMVMYQQNNRSVAHMQWVNGRGYTGWNERGGSFAGDPVLVQFPSLSRVDFLGTGKDRQIYHFSWSRASNYTALESIGGDFESVPAVVITNSSRLDLLAVGTDDMLKHRALVGSAWASEWEDLGVFANSAPHVVALGGSTPYRIGIFILGKENDVLFATWEVKDDLSWKGMSKFESIQGDMATTWMEPQ
ncbi:hypothetical protein ACEPPN_010244 [Leptodophora sp. 'Broadleaf-Isolate-01']